MNVLAWGHATFQRTGMIKGSDSVIISIYGLWIGIFRLSINKNLYIFYNDGFIAKSYLYWDGKRLNISPQKCHQVFHPPLWPRG